MCMYLTTVFYLKNMTVLATDVDNLLSCPADAKTQKSWSDTEHFSESGNRVYSYFPDTFSSSKRKIKIAA